MSTFCQQVDDWMLLKIKEKIIRRNVFEQNKKKPILGDPGAVIVGSGEKAGRKFSSTGERAPGYRLSPNYFQKFKRIPAPDWAQ